MSAPFIAPEAPPQFHPEFGYFWPAPQFRRVVRVALICTICGAAAGAVAVLAGMPALSTDPDTVAGVAQADAGAPPTTVGMAATLKAASDPKVAPMATDNAVKLTAGACSEQTWPYLDGKCLSGFHAAALASKNVRVLRPDEQAESAPAMVMAGPSDKDVVKAAAQAQSQAQSQEKAAKKEKKHARAKRGRQRDDPDRYEAYASPYRGGYEPRDREWGWGGW